MFPPIRKILSACLDRFIFGLSTDIRSSETVLESLWKQFMTKTYKSLSTGIKSSETVWRVYGNSLRHGHMDTGFNLRNGSNWNATEFSTDFHNATRA